MTKGNSSSHSWKCAEIRLPESESLERLERLARICRVDGERSPPSGCRVTCGTMGRGHAFDRIVTVPCPRQTDTRLSLQNRVPHVFGEETPIDALPGPNVDLIRSMGVIKAAEITPIFTQTLQFQGNRKFSRMS